MKIPKATCQLALHHGLWHRIGWYHLIDQTNTNHPIMKTRLIKTGIGYSLNTLQKAATLKASHDKSSTKKHNQPPIFHFQEWKQLWNFLSNHYWMFLWRRVKPDWVLASPASTFQPLRQPTLVTVKYKSKQKQMGMKTKTKPNEKFKCNNFPSLYGNQHQSWSKLVNTD